MHGRKLVSKRKTTENMHKVFRHFYHTGEYFFCESDKDVENI